MLPVILLAWMPAHLLHASDFSSISKNRYLYEKSALAIRRGVFFMAGPQYGIPYRVGSGAVRF